MLFLQREYKEFILSEFKNNKNFDSNFWNSFFSTLFPGMMVLQNPHTGERTCVDAFECFKFYEEMLLKMQNIDTRKYQKIHKGTPYYFMGWFSFYTRNYSTSLFYFLNSVHEDIRTTRKNRTTWDNLPAFSFLKLDSTKTVAGDDVEYIKEILIKKLDEFSLTTKSDFKFDLFQQVMENLIHKKKYELIISIYIFLLESIIVGNESKFLGNLQGNVRNICNLFQDGGLIFESLLRIKYKQKENDTLRQLFQSPEFKKRYPNLNINTSLSKFEELIPFIKNFSPNMQNSFEVTTRLRNFSMHEIRNSRFFSNQVNLQGLSRFKKLVTYQIYSIFYILKEDFCVSSK